jgi:hypothetical protein
MIEELKWEKNYMQGGCVYTQYADVPEVVDKLNELIRYINEKEKGQSYEKRKLNEKNQKIRS